ncbi:calcium release-activated calcium channel protein 1-like isoform X2 [Photinus pyralis]|uniref:calcium release-activated calcium channel protein 1-like isoform X2 n=1 Tax=Photinus pyralis TaxID=7054 RepID=UPI001266FB1A|nr:calcium release-activated calcium channel protein 1-like isoform X2 [Photinus pyralis]
MVQGYLGLSKAVTARSSQMDQSPQASLGPKRGRNVLQRYNTTSGATPPIVPQIRITPRPRSLNLHNEIAPPNFATGGGELTLSVISRDRSSPHFLQVPPLPYQPSERSQSIASCCRCELEETPKNLLSWRRLHMSRAKLKATSTTSELLSGFAMVAMVELQINEGTAVPEWLFVMFSVCTTVLVAVHIFALMISTYILPNIDAISKLEVSELVSESPHERMKGFIQLAWAFSTVLGNLGNCNRCDFVGLFLFLVEVAILCWVKFWDYSFTAAIAATVIVIPVLVIFVLFVVHFYHSLVAHRCDTSVEDLEGLENMKKHLDHASSPV